MRRLVFAVSLAFLILGLASEFFAPFAQKCPGPALFIFGGSAWMAIKHWDFR
jgi:hypothetical protein